MVAYIGQFLLDGFIKWLDMNFIGQFRVSMDGSPQLTAYHLPPSAYHLPVTTYRFPQQQEEMKSNIKRLRQQLGELCVDLANNAANYASIWRIMRRLMRR